MKNKIVTILLCFFSTTIFAQLENSNWYFGNGAGLNFNGATSVLNNGQTNLDFHHSAVASDASGNLLFYSDGVSVWNENSYFTNGDNTLTGGGKTIVIVPFPDNTDKYYLFTSKLNAYLVIDYQYSIVNVTTNTVEILNQQLNLFESVNDFNDPDFDNIVRTRAYRDHMTVAKHADEESYWLLINPFDKFFALKIDSSGISDPIISEAEGHYSEQQYLELVDTGGSGMSISQDMSKIAYFTNYSYPGSGYHSEIHLYDFNTTTGAISYTNAIKDSDYSGFFFGYGFSVAFSPNGDYLYANSNAISTTSDKLFQFDLNNILNAPFVTNLSGSDGLGYKHYTLRLAIDGKIYLPNSLNSTTLNVINNPNNFGAAAGFVESQINLGHNKNTKLLPQLIPFQTQALGCQENVPISQDVQQGQTDSQQASSTIIATNSIHNNAVAAYNAGLKITLSPDFHAEAGSSFRAFIEDCSAGRFHPNKATPSKNELSILNEKEQIVAFPNPTNGLIKIKSNRNVHSWNLSNHDGRTVSESNSNSIIQNEFSLNLETLKEGIYYLKIMLVNGNVVLKKLVRK
ncbi:hypothetical protein ULMA_05680 [Patiriisocius marinus]|uniref:Secretion system C-terminal sorting domain-containing protein n=1 Tax=Patiriisocius marinus TaxID=1397112 RepID=A0A5J4IX69_9FLAO|nr:3-coathanger stack domain-containing protein [Patiriisocius marinus]GER58460.1 hypothetical protein ULMA_05680 [Patiriisocius marinus]